MSVQEQVESLVGQAEALRAQLLDERAGLIARVKEIDALIVRLPRTARRAAPLSMEAGKDRLRLLLAHEVGRDRQPVNSRDIMHAAATFFGLTVAQITGPERFSSVAHARHVAMFLSRKLTGESFPELGFAFGGRDHTTVIVAVRKIEAQVLDETAVRAEVEALEFVIREAQTLRTAPPASSVSVTSTPHAVANLGTQETRP